MSRRAASEKSTRMFEPVSAKDPTDKYHRVRIMCSEDRCNETLIFSRRGVINPHQAASWFRDKGWTVGGDKRSDLCPTHGKRHKEEPVKSPDLGTDAAIPPAAGKPDEHTPGAPHKVTVSLPVDRGFSLPKAPPLQVVSAKGEVTPLPKPVVVLEEIRPGAVFPVTPSRLEKRVIRLKMEEVYVDEDTGYKDGWTDQRVASDLNLPIEWIAAVRKEDYGPERGAGLTKVVSGIEEKWSQMQESMVFIEDLVKESEALWKKMDDKLDEYDQQKAELKTMMIDFNRKKS